MPEVTVLACDRTGARSASADVRVANIKVVVAGGMGNIELSPMLSQVSRRNLVRVIESAIKPPKKREPKPAAEASA